MPSLTLLVVPVIVSAISILLVMAFWNRKNNFPVEGRTVIVTGGSQGLGLAIAQRLASKGAHVAIVAQDIPKLKRAVETIQASAIRTSQRFLHLSYDLRSSDSALKILSDVTEWNSGHEPDIIFCCAGFCHPGFFADISIEDLRSQMDTIYWSCAYMAHAALNLWTKPIQREKEVVETPARHIIFTSSALAFFPVAGYTAYTPAKAAMRALADSLNQEVAVYNGSRLSNNPMAPNTDIKVHCAFPMGILSPGFDNEQKMKPQLTQILEEDDKPQKPEDVALAITNGLEAGDYLITTQFVGHVLRGCGMGGSIRNGLLDLFWSFIGSLAILYFAPALRSKCKAWGKEHGIKTKPVRT